MLKRTVIALSTLSLAVSACGQKEEIRSVSALRPDKTNPDRFTCPKHGTRPTVNPEYKIDWGKIASVGEAKAAHDNFVLVLRGRERTVADYVLDLEAINSICAANMQWQRDFYSGLDNPPQP